jgi:hypothetical protein
MRRHLERVRDRDAEPRQQHDLPTEQQPDRPFSLRHFAKIPPLEFHPDREHEEHGY